MVEEARLALAHNDIKQIDFTQGSAEDLWMLRNSTVDLVVAGMVLSNYRVTGKFSTRGFLAQSAHWFDWNKVWPEISRILRPGGTVSIWVGNFVHYSGLPSRSFRDMARL